MLNFFSMLKIMVFPLIFSLYLGVFTPTYSFLISPYFFLFFYFLYYFYIC